MTTLLGVLGGSVTVGIEADHAKHSCRPGDTTSAEQTIGTCKVQCSLLVAEYRESARPPPWRAHPAARTPTSGPTRRTLRSAT